MGTVFKAVPGEIAGLGNLVADIGSDAEAAATFIGVHGPAADWLSGPIIDDLITPVREGAEATKRRMGDIATHTKDTSTELNKAAWMFHNQDQQTYEELNNHTVNGSASGHVAGNPNTEKPGITDAYMSPVPISKSAEFTLPVPESDKDDTIELVSELFPTLAKLNDTIKEIGDKAGFEIDPLASALRPIPGNWPEVRRIGEAYAAAGNGMEACGVNLENGSNAISDGWDGKAAAGYDDWSARQVAAMKWEGPVGRILGEVLAVVSDEIRAAVKAILEKLWSILEDQIDFQSVKGVFKTIGRRIPVVGQAYEIYNLAQKIYTIVNSAVDLVKKIQDLVDRVKELLEIVKDPVGKAKEAAQDKLEEKLEPFTEAFEKAQKADAIRSDVEQMSQVDATLNRPKEDYEVGSGNQPWANQ